MFDMMEVLAKIIMVTILKYISIWNPQFVNFSVTQCLMSIISQ